MGVWGLQEQYQSGISKHFTERTPEVLLIGVSELLHTNLRVYVTCITTHTLTYSVAHVMYIS